MQQTFKQGLSALQRIRIWYALLVFVGAIFVVRLFYLQVIRHEYYQTAAFKSQLKEYEIPAQRGIISARTGDKITPLVLNQKLYTLFADPTFVTDSEKAAGKLQPIIGGKTDDIEKLLKAPDTRYVVLGKKLSKDQQSKIAKLKLKGIGTRESEYRTYPNGQLAAQVLGFVNQDGQGAYGIEQALDKDLTGKPGTLKAITDAQGVPLVGNKDNVVTSPQAGKQVVLTLDLGMQQMVEDSLKSGLDAAKSKQGSIIVLDVHNGAVKAMANYPTYNPGEYYKQEDASVFGNPAISRPLEVGSIMKTLTLTAGIDQGVITKDSTYNDPGLYNIDDHVVTNIEGNKVVGAQSMQSLLNLSLNTGATWVLMQMGGGQINKQARTAWHDYMVNHYHFGSPTGIEQGNNSEAAGTVPDPEKGYGLNISYANTAFGQGVSTTLLQVVAADAAVLNGGTYYTPHLVDGYVDPVTDEFKPVEPKIWKKNIVKPETSKSLQALMQGVAGNNYNVYKLRKPTEQYSIGGKTGTAEIASPDGGYYGDRYNGYFLGFVGGDTPQYMIIVWVNEPHIAGYAGAAAAAPIFSKVATTLIDNFNVTPRSVPAQ